MLVVGKRWCRDLMNHILSMFCCRWFDFIRSEMSLKHQEYAMNTLTWQHRHDTPGQDIIQFIYWYIYMTDETILSWLKLLLLSSHPVLTLTSSSNVTPMCTELQYDQFKSSFLSENVDRQPMSHGVNAVLACLFAHRDELIYVCCWYMSPLWFISSSSPIHRQLSCHHFGLTVIRLWYMAR